MTSHLVAISLGSNILPVNNLREAVRLLYQKLDIHALSEVWETPAVGADGPNFYNCALLAMTGLNPDQLKLTLLRPIEAKLGRIRTADKYAPRTIDLDVIVYDHQVIDTRLWIYAYLAVPISHLLPSLQNPQTGENLETAAERLRTTSQMVLHPDIFSVNWISDR